MYIYEFIYLFIYLFICLIIYLLICLIIYLFINLFIYTYLLTIQLVLFYFCPSTFIVLTTITFNKLLQF